MNKTHLLSFAVQFQRKETTEEREDVKLRILERSQCPFFSEE